MLANRRRLDETLEIWKDAAGENDYKIEPDKIKERDTAAQMKPIVEAGAMTEEMWRDEVYLRE